MKLKGMKTANDKAPEFAIMSRRPGIGCGYAHEIASEVLKHNLEKVPTDLRNGKVSWPLGRYMREKVSEFSQTPKAVYTEIAKDVQKLSDEVFENPAYPPGYKEFALRERIIKHRHSKAAALERRLEEQERAKAL
jgi:hypothetical protein